MRSCNPRLGRFDSCAAPLSRRRSLSRDRLGLRLALTRAETPLHQWILFSAIGVALGATVTVPRILGNELTVATVVLVALLLISGLLSTLFAMLFDMESNRELR